MDLKTFCKEHKKWIARGGWAVFFIAFTLFTLFFNTTLEYEKPGDAEIGVTYEKARVISVDQEDMGPDPDFPYIQIGKQWLTLEILTGELKGRSTTAVNFVERVNNKPAQVGTEMIISSYDGFVTTSVVNYSRENYLYILGILFLAFILLFGRSKGFKSIVALAFTLVCVLFVMVPMIIRGVNPILAAAVVVVVSTAVNLLMLNGWSRKNAIAAAGSIISTMIAGIISFLIGMASHLDTLNTEEAELLLFVSGNSPIQIRDLLFAGILIAAMGAVMDTSMSIASSLYEMKQIDPTLTSRQLLRSGMNVGRDIMGTMTDTLILAFTGSSLNIILIYYMYAMPYLGLINLDLIAVEIVRGLSGSIAIALSIPITALIAARALHGPFAPGKKGKGRPKGLSA